jgi:hypothetical protein
VNYLGIAGYQWKDRLGAGNMADYFRFEIVFLEKPQIFGHEQHHMAGCQTAESCAEFILGSNAAVQTQK